MGAADNLTVLRRRHEKAVADYAGTPPETLYSWAADEIESLRSVVRQMPWSMPGVRPIWTPRQKDAVRRALDNGRTETPAETVKNGRTAPPGAGS